MHFARVFLLLLLLSAGCRSWRAASAPYAQRAVPMPVDRMLRDSPFAEVARAARLPALDSVVLPAGAREIRITDWYPMVYGAGVPYLRLVDVNGRISGELLEWWGARRTGQPGIQTERGAYCSALEDPHRVCIRPRPLPSGLSWRAVADSLDALGAWTLSAGCAGGGEGSMTDAGELLIRVLQNEQYRASECNAPNYRHSETGRDARAIYAFLYRLSGR